MLSSDCYGRLTKKPAKQGGRPEYLEENLLGFAGDSHRDLCDKLRKLIRSVYGDLPVSASGPGAVGERRTLAVMLDAETWESSIGLSQRLSVENRPAVAQPRATAGITTHLLSVVVQLN
jgi:hypothetical protein